MVYKLKIIFTKEPQDIENYELPEWEYLYKTDKLIIKPGDMVKSKRFFTPMQIISIEKKDTYPYNCKFLEIDEILTSKNLKSMSNLVSIIEKQVEEYMEEHPGISVETAIKKVTGQAKKNPMSTITDSVVNSYKAVMSRMAPEIDNNLRLSTAGVICVPTSDGMVIFFDPMTGERMEAPAMISAKIPVYICQKPIEQVVEGDIIKLSEKNYARVSKSYAAGDDSIKCVTYLTGANHSFKPVHNSMMQTKTVRCVMNNFGSMISMGFNPAYMSMLETEDGETPDPMEMMMKMTMLAPMMNMMGGQANQAAPVANPMAMMNPFMGMMNPMMGMPGMMPQQAPAPQAQPATPVATVEVKPKSMEDMSVEELEALLASKKQAQEDAAKKAELIRQIKEAEEANK